MIFEYTHTKEQTLDVLYMIKETNGTIERIVNSQDGKSILTLTSISKDMLDKYFEEDMMYKYTLGLETIYGMEL